MDPEQFFNDLLKDAENNIETKITTTAFVVMLTVLAQINGVKVEDKVIGDIKIFNITRDRVKVKLECKQLMKEGKILISYSLV